MMRRQWILAARPAQGVSSNAGAMADLWAAERLGVDLRKI